MFVLGFVCCVLNPAKLRLSAVFFGCTLEAAISRSCGGFASTQTQQAVPMVRNGGACNVCSSCSPYHGFAAIVQPDDTTPPTFLKMENSTKEPNCYWGSLDECIMLHE